MMRHVVWCAVAAVVLCGAAAFGADVPAWKAGLARAKVTPAEPVHLAGYASRNRPFESVAADIHVKALALEDAAGHRGLLITSDLIGFRAAIAEEVCRRITAETGLKRSQILLNSSHTHTGPLVSLDEEPLADSQSPQDVQATIRYTKWLVDQTVKAAAEAVRGLRPARLAWGTGVESFVMNRREFTPTGVRLGVNPRGLVDRSVPVLRIESPDGRLRGVLFGAACHNTTLTGEHYVVSGDYAGFAQAEIERRHPDVQAMFLLGCAGSANPYPRGTLELARQHGRTLADEVCRLLDSKSLRPVAGPLRTELDTVDLPLQATSREAIDRLLAHRGGWEAWAGKRMLAQLERGQSLPESYRTVVALWQFGDDLTLVGLPGEVVVDYVPLLEQALGPLKLWPAAYCNDVFGYLPSAQVLSEGGYETRGLIHGGIGLFAPEAERTLVAKVRTLAQRAGRPLPPGHENATPR